MTPAGRRDRRIILQRATVATDDFGVEGPTSWAELQKAWAMVRYGTSAERRTASVEGASQTATFRVLSTSVLRTVTVRDRILMDGAGWNITGIVPVGMQGAELEFTATIAKG